MKRVLLFLIPILLFSSCQTLKVQSEETLSERENLRNNRSFFNDEWVPADDLFDKYYGDVLFGLPDASYYPVWFNSGNYKMSAIVFEPQKVVKGTVLVVHGYAGNTLGFKHIINRLLKNGYRVAALSLPGHELSGGERGDIDDFTSYGLAVEDFIDLLKEKDMEPRFAIGHSTGCTSLIIYNQNYGSSFEKIVFIAPLIRSAKWYPSKFARFISKPFLSFYNTNWSGPLAVEVFPMHWFDELGIWNKEFKDYYSVNTPLLIIQGERDSVVDWKYNLSSIEKKYPNTEILKFKEGSHTLFMKNSGFEEKISNKILYEFFF